MNDDERGPKLTLMEEVLLLGIKDKQGYLSFWNDNISYALRGCILIELALRKRITLDKSAGHVALPERTVTVINGAQTGETILDETLRMMSSTPDKLTLNTWLDLLSGETWNVLKIGYQLKQVRERLAKGLVDKGVLRTEKRNFLLFDMATHPVADPRAKEAIVTRVLAVLRGRTRAVAPEVVGDGGSVVRSVALVCAAYAGSVLDNAMGRLSYEDREEAFQRADDILAEFGVWPFGGSTEPSRRRPRIAMGGVADGRENIMGLVDAVKNGAGDELEMVAAVLEVLAKLDSLI